MEEAVKLILNKNQKTSGLMNNKISYSLEVKADLTHEELENIKKYNMSDTVLYSNVEGNPTESAWKAIKTIATSTVIKVSDLANGRLIECKDFMEIIAVEEQVKSACVNLKNLLEAMANFGGEEVIEI